ncbi:MAG: hypothetical protein MUC51_07350 [Anaerolineae bacterium]|jgi:hypothetical protein|nr:hypothetical protein [Anaerolineae bacterium]
MRPLLSRLLTHTPAIVKRPALVQLFRATAAAFQADMPRLSGRSREQCLLAYARFTADQAEEALRRGGDISELQERLYRNAYRLGRMPGWLLGSHSVSDVMALGRSLYDILDIDFHGNDSGSGSGEITISRCYFSSFYSPQACQVMSAMDRGLLAGLAGGGELVFIERITEGQPCCRARFTLAGNPVLAQLWEE